MKMKHFATLGFGLALAGAANAGSIPYADIGIEAPVATFVAAADGDVSAYFFSSDAGYDSQIGLKINGVSTGVYGLWNHGSSYGQSIVLGTAQAGDTLEFVLQVLSTGGYWYSNPANNSDQRNHTYTTAFGGDDYIPEGTYVAFEDLPGLGDVDYNDHQFVFTNAKNAEVPEPAGVALFGFGLLAMGALRRKKA